MIIEKESWGQTGDGQEVELYSLVNDSGMKVQITNYGGIVTSILAPGKDGAFEDVALGFPTLEGYLGEHPYFGAIVGRYGNRIAKGKFTLDGEEYTLAVNNGPNALHGGIEGFDDRVWAAREMRDENAVGLRLHYVSEAGEEGYPGALDTTVTYWLTSDNAIKIHYEATTDAPTPVNLTNHSYFNLAGQGDGDILGHVMMLNADRFLPVDETLIPTGERRPVEGTPFDFTTPKPIGRDIDADNQQMEYGGGYDHCFVLKSQDGSLALAARVTEPTTGRVMEVYTTEPGVQFYTGNFLDGTLTGKGGKVYKHRFGFCLETQHFPDSPNQPDFPGTILRPGETYRSTTVYKFSAK